MFCGKTNVPIGTKVKIVKNLEGNECEPFVNCIGTATHPFYLGCKKPDWIGVLLDNDTIYGKKFNFHISEIEFYE
jgi:hypothetical protein